MGRFDAHEGECTKNPTPLFFHRFGRGRFGRGGVLGRFWGGFFSSKTAVMKRQQKTHDDKNVFRFATSSLSIIK
jgi:hypothetical protein